MTRRRTPSVPAPRPPVQPLLRRPAGGVPYPALLLPSTPDPHRVGRAVVGVALGLVVFLLVSPSVAAGVTALGWLAEGRPTGYRAYAAEAAGFLRPVGMLAANLSIAVVLIPVSVVLVAVWHRRRPGWLISVRGRVRWRWLGLSLALALPVFAGLAMATAGGQPFRPTAVTSTMVAFAVIVVLTSPLQAAAEEIFFRGYLTQAVGSLGAGPWPAIVVSSLVFALLHGTQNLPLFLNRFAFGLLAGLLAWTTGGLEAPIAAHVVNNALAYGAATLTGTVAELRGVAEVTWTTALVGIAGYAAFTVLALLAGRRFADRTAPLPAPERP